jgi:hypothetical protein
MMHVLLSLADTAAGDSWSDAQQAHAQRGSAVIRRRRARTGRRPVRRLMRRGLRTLGQLRRGPELARLGARLGRDAAGAVGDIVLTPPDSDTALRGVPSVAKRIAWSGPVPLAEIKTIGRRLGGTVNDVLLTALAGALQRYGQLRGDDLPADVVLRALMPVNLRPTGAEAELGNRISAVFLSLPVEIADPFRKVTISKKLDSELVKDMAPIAAVAVGLAMRRARDSS